MERKRAGEEIIGFFIDYVFEVDKNLRQRGIAYERYPRRDELLSMLDYDNESLDRISLLIGNLPSNFLRITK